ncbi:MAG: DUF2179 domain-containing protein [Planctomycetes bacterium]|jgi:uncharacterized protein YebE (UPF0316 family)|nr:DUF2179 domain-containing protein [Planctomycetota bacterium]
MEALLEWVEQYPVLLAGFIVVARIADVSLGTMRTIAVVRGYRALAVTLGFWEVIIWALVVSGVLVSPSLLKIVAYAAGFALGNAVGMWIEGRIALGQRMVMIISRARQQSVAFALRLAGYVVTEVPAKGHKGNVALCLTVVSRRKVPLVEEIARGVDEKAFVTVQEASSVLVRKTMPLTHQPTGWRAVFKKK